MDPGLVGLAPGLPAHALQAASAFQDRALYAAAVLGGGQPGLPPLRPLAAPEASDLSHGLGSVAGAVLIALVTLYRDRLPAALLAALRAAIQPPLVALRSLQTGNVTDYVTWISVGGAVLALAFGVTLR